MEITKVKSSQSRIETKKQRDIRHAKHQMRMKQQAVAKLVRKNSHRCGITQHLQPKKLESLPVTLTFG